MVKKTIREMRVDRKIGQREMSEMLGVTQAALSQYERGRRRPEYVIAVKIAKIFGCELSDIRFIEKENAGKCGHDGRKMCMKCGKILVGNKVL